MGFLYQLRLPDGTDKGQAEYAYQPVVGDLIHLDGNQRMRVTAFVPIERMQEHTSRPLYGILEIQPL